MIPLDSLLVAYPRPNFATSTSEALDTIGSIATNATLVLIEPIPVPPFEPLDWCITSVTDGRLHFCVPDPIPSQIVYRYEARWRPNVETSISTNGLSELPRVRAPVDGTSIRRPDHINSEPAGRRRLLQQLEPSSCPSTDPERSDHGQPCPRTIRPSAPSRSRPEPCPAVRHERIDDPPRRHRPIDRLDTPVRFEHRRATDTILDGRYQQPDWILARRDWPSVFSHETRNAEHGRFSCTPPESVKTSRHRPEGDERGDSRGSASVMESERRQQTTRQVRDDREYERQVGAISLSAPTNRLRRPGHPRWTGDAS